MSKRDTTARIQTATLVSMRDSKPHKEIRKATFDYCVS